MSLNDLKKRPHQHKTVRIVKVPDGPNMVVTFLGSSLSFQVYPTENDICNRSYEMCVISILEAYFFELCCLSLHVLDLFVGLAILRQWSEIDQNCQLVSPEKLRIHLLCYSFPLSSTAKGGGGAFKKDVSETGLYLSFCLVYSRNSNLFSAPFVDAIYAAVLYILSECVSLKSLDCCISL